MKTLVFLLLLSWGLGVPLLFAQNEPPEPPRSSDASVIDQRTFEGATAELIEEEEKKPQIEKPPEVEKPSAALEAKFFVREILLRGNQAIETEKLRSFITPFEGRDLTLTEANQLAGQIEREYRRRGYITTLAYLPPQRIENQTLLVEVLEGRLGALHIEGNRWFSKETIRRQWGLKKGRVLRYRDLERAVRRLNESPDREIRVILRPGEETGFTDVYLKVKDEFPLHGNFQFDNQGTRPSGRRRFGFTFRHNDWLIPDSTLLTGTTFGQSFASVFAHYLIPVNSFGTKLIAGFSHSQVRPQREFKGSDVHGISATYSVTLRQTLLDSERWSSHASFGFDIKDGRTRDTSGVRRRDRPRILRTDFELTERDTRGIINVSNQFSFGIKGLGALGENNPLAGRAGAEPNFFTYSGKLSRSLVLPFKTQAVFKFETQLSPHKLIPQEEFYLGGADTVRGYPEGDYLADQGISFSFEYLVPFFFVPKDWKLPRSQIPLWRQLEMVFFYDEAYGQLRGPSSAELKQRHLIGLGGGLRVHLLDHVYARIELAHALGDEPITESDHTRLHFQIQAEV